jgi:hypothetical protein
MSDPLNERLNKILPRVISDEFLSGSGIGNEIAFHIFDYPPEDELRVRDYLRTLLDHIPKSRMTQIMKKDRTRPGVVVSILSVRSV